MHISSALFFSVSDQAAALFTDNVMMALTTLFGNCHFLSFYLHF